MMTKTAQNHKRTRRLIGFRADVELVQQLHAAARAQGVRKGEFVVQALQKALAQ